MEYVGGVKIEDVHYPGEDKYCDGEVEDRILAYVSENPGIRYSDIPPENRDWPTLYHLSPLRENIVSWLPIKRTDKVLEVGSGCGAITGVVAEKAKSVTCVELSYKRSLINANRNRDKDNITIQLGNFQDIEPDLDYDYDYILLIGVLEYAGLYIQSQDPFVSMVAMLKNHLGPTGRLVIAIENRLGLKYFAGNREDHVGEYFSGIEDYVGGGPIRTFSRNKLDGICRAAGFGYTSFYYPYPDYKFMTTLFSDKRLPREGELTDNMRNFDHDRLYLFDEKAAYDAIITDGLFPVFSNSYLVVAGPPVPLIFARYSNDRTSKFAIRTEIRHPSVSPLGSAIEALSRDNNIGINESFDKDKLEVRKVPLYADSVGHVMAMGQTYNKLIKTYPGNGLVITPVYIDGGQAVFPYINGRTLEEVLDRCLDSGDEARFRQFFDYYYNLLTTVEDKEIANYDFIFSNIIIAEDNRWYLIDYEWMPPKRATLDELAGRALFCYGLGSAKRMDIARLLLAEKFGCSDEELIKLAGREDRFQRFTTGGVGSMVDVRNALNMPIIPVMDQIRRYLDDVAFNKIQIYEDFGKGYSEENSYFLPDFYPENKLMSVDIDIPPGLVGIRIDPALDYCLLHIKSIAFDATVYTLTELEDRLDTNGLILGNGLVLFSSKDPYLSIGRIGDLTETARPKDDSGTVVMRVELEMVRVSKGIGLAALEIGDDDEDDDEGEGLIGGLKGFVKKLPLRRR